MDDLIRRQDAISLLKKWSDGYAYIENETELAIKEFQELPSAQPEPKWIPVSEKAHPTKEGRYLVTDDAGGITTIEVDDFIYCDDGSGMWLYSQNVTAWMPLPELPQVN